MGGIGVAVGTDGPPQATVSNPNVIATARSSAPSRTDSAGNITSLRRPDGDSAGCYISQFALFAQLCDVYVRSRRFAPVAAL